jgi:hypothetical protein
MNSAQLLLVSMGCRGVGHRPMSVRELTDLETVSDYVQIAVHGRDGRAG